MEKLKIRLKTYYAYLIILVVVLFVFSVVRNIFRAAGAKNEIKVAQERVEKLKKENEEIQKRLSEVQDQVYIEIQLRDKLGLAKEGEIIVVLPDKETLKKLAPVISEEEDTLPDPTWRKWLKLFLN